MLGWLPSMSVTQWLLAILVILLIRYLWHTYRYVRIFTKMGIPYPMPIPIVGSRSAVDVFVYGITPAFERSTKLYGKVYGSHTLNSEPALVVSDLEMLREIFVKKFQYFPNRQNRPSLNMKPWKDTLLEVMGDHWKHIRSMLSPTFSSGKIKRMMPAIQQVTATLTDHLNGVAAKGDMVELKELCGCFALDVIGAAAFGIDVSSIHNPDCDFVKHTTFMINPESGKIIMFLFMISPSLLKWSLKLGLFPAL